MYVFDPRTQRIRHCGDLGEACGEKGLKAVAQGKSHVNFVECQGKLYFATHIGYYSIIDGMEKPGIPPAGVGPYPGGHFLAYDMSGGRFENLAVAPHREGIITMNMDTRRGRLYGITWPTGYFCYYDLAAKRMRDCGLFAEQGEAGKGPAYRTLCRSMAVDPADGSVYFSTAGGDIFRYRYDRDRVERVEGENLRKDYFGQYDPASPGNMGYNWRQVFWHPEEHVIYGVHGNSGYLFRFDPAARRIDLLERLTSLPSKRSGMYDQFSYGYLGFKLGPDKRTIYYLTGGPIYIDGRRVKGKATTAKGEAKGLEDLHLVTYDIPTGQVYRPRSDLLCRRSTADVRQFARHRRRRHGLRPEPLLRPGAYADRLDGRAALGVLYPAHSVCRWKKRHTECAGYIAWTKRHTACAGYIKEFFSWQVAHKCGFLSRRLLYSGRRHAHGRARRCRSAWPGSTSRPTARSA